MTVIKLSSISFLETTVATIATSKKKKKKSKQGGTQHNSLSLRLSLMVVILAYGLLWQGPNKKHICCWVAQQDVPDCH